MGENVGLDINYKWCFCVEFKVSCFYFIQFRQINKNEITKYEGPKCCTQIYKKMGDNLISYQFSLHNAGVVSLAMELLIVFFTTTEKNMMFNSMQWC